MTETIEEVEVLSQEIVQLVRYQNRLFKVKHHKPEGAKQWVEVDEVHRSEDRKNAIYSLGYARGYTKGNGAVKLPAIKVILDRYMEDTSKR